MINHDLIVDLIFSSLFVGIGLVIAGSSGRQIWFFLSSSKWPRRPGVIVFSEIKQDEDTRLFVEVDYCFEVAGHKIRGTRMRFGFRPDDRSETRSEAEKRAAHFQVGAEVSVLHHPKNPRICVLERSLDKGLILVLVFGLIFAGFGASAVVGSIR